MQPQFLVIDDNRDGRCVVARAVQRKFHEAPLHEFATLAEAMPILKRVEADPGRWIVVTGQTAEHTAVALAAAIRAMHARVPIIVLGHNEAAAALAAGATHFVEYEAWLLLGGLIQRLAGGGERQKAP